LQGQKWGQCFQTRTAGGEAPALPEARELVALYDRWTIAADDDERAKIWLKMLAIVSQQVFCIGIVSRAPQPIVVGNTVRNVPAEGVYSWDPGAYLGMYHPDTFWIDTDTGKGTP
jgi:peptide/nickel transport system substrate-binding protein